MVRNTTAYENKNTYMIHTSFRPPAALPATYSRRPFPVFTAMTAPKTTHRPGVFGKWKYLPLLPALFLQLFAFSQPADKYATFSAQKQTIALRTGIVMKYIQVGNPSGIPVILLHGYTDSGRSFQQMMEALAKENEQFRIIAPDLRGHGESSMPDSNRCRETPEACFTPADYASDVISLMNQLNIAKAHLTGHSMGSIVAQELALQYPGRVHSLTLIGTFVNGKESPVIRDILIAGLIEKEWRAALEKRPGFRWPADAWSLTPQHLGNEAMQFLKETWVFDPVADDAFIRAILTETANVRLGTWIGAIKALGKVDNRKALKNLKKPTLILWATQDNMFMEKPDQEWVKTAFETASKAGRTRIFYKTYGKTPLSGSGMQENEVGHNLHWGAPEAVAADIASFIRYGVPKNDRPYADPTNTKRILTDGSADNITVWGRQPVPKR